MNWKVWAKVKTKNYWIITIWEIKEDWEWEYIISTKWDDIWYIWESDKELLKENILTLK